MNGKIPVPQAEDIPSFDRRFFESDNVVSRIGRDSIGGKASGLAFAASILASEFPEGAFESLHLSIPRLVVIGTSVFDAFMERNDLKAVVADCPPDDRIALAFMRADFPAEFAGDLRSLIGVAHAPLAVRSSSRLEDDMFEPFAGVYGTKMIPNNQPDTDTRYRKLIEAVKFVYASTYFAEGRGYASFTGKAAEEEKMAVIIQEVVGLRHQDRFYPNLSGVARSYNFYPVGRANPDEGAIDLALGLGKTIVDGGKVWNYSPTHPGISPPFTTSDMLRNSQTDFWAVNMGTPPAYDPIQETEYMVKGDLSDAEADDTLRVLASTCDPANNRLMLGTGRAGPHVLNFAPLLQLGDIPVNKLMVRLLDACQKAVGAPVEIEFAATSEDRPSRRHHRLGFLQVRPMVASSESVDLPAEDLSHPDTLISSEKCLGNGMNETLTDIIYVKPDSFDKEHTRKIAAQIGELNRGIVNEGRNYVLIGFGRWGSSDQYLGIPVDWAQISGARVIVEATLPEMNVDLSQGSHFFHDITSLQVPYLCVSFEGPHQIDWAWIENQSTVA